MKYLEIDYIKQHSRIDDDYDDALLELYGEAAEETVLLYLNRGRTPQEAYDNLVAEYGTVPAMLRVATLMLVDVSYQFRSPISQTNMSQVPYTFDLIVKPFMRLTSYEPPKPDDNGIQ